MKPTSKDEADIAAEQEEYARREALWKVKEPERIPHRGKCLHCDEPSSEKFCDVDCRKDWEKEQAVRKAQRGQLRLKHREEKAK
jgi:hypothetical protein